MKPSYAPDNTRSSIVVILLLAAGVSIVAVLMGLSDKPDVTSIGVSVTEAEVASLTDGDLISDNFGVPDSTSADDIAGTDGSAEFDATSQLGDDGNAIQDDSANFSVPAPVPATDSADGTGEAATDESAAAGAAIAVATATPAPTPEVAAAVEPTLIPDTSVADELDALAVPARITAGTVGGQFFTRPDEDEGATVTRNELTLTLNEDGTGSFAGVLDMTLADTTHITLAMSGQIRWSGDSPQVLADLTGTYNRDSPIDSDDTSSTDAELTITSLGSGSGSLCTPACVGFTFPPQTGL